MDVQTVLIFLVACIALTATPGPDMLLIVARSVAQGRMAGLVTYLGVAVGGFFHAALLALGLSQLFLAVPFAYDIVRYLGAAYLAWLAWQAFTARAEEGMATVTERRRPAVVLFRQGMLSNVLNPKVALFFLALFPQFIDPERGAVGAQVMVLALVLNLVGLVVNGVVILLAGALRRAARERRVFARWSRVFLGTVFAGLALRLALDSRD